MSLELAPSANKKLLVIDPSGSHLAFSIVSIDDKVLTFHYVGMLWTQPSWGIGKRLSYMERAFKFLLNLKNHVVDSMYTEAFFVNKFKMSGISVIPTVNNLMQKVIYEEDSRIGYKEISPTTWRKVLGIKAVTSDTGGKDYKFPTETYVKNNIKVPLPDEIISNITFNLRARPNDITDVMAISMAIGKTLGCTEFDVTSYCFNYGLFYNSLKELYENFK
jgi:hypothetical protein